MPFFAARLIVLCGLVLLAACSDKDGGTGPDYVATASGRLDSGQEARFLAAERDGRIARLLVRPGQPVTQGQPLLEVWCEDVAADAAAARAEARALAADSRLIADGPRSEELKQGEARAREMGTRRTDAADELARAEGMRANGFVTERRLAALRAELDAANAKTAEADAALLALRNGSRTDERVAAGARADAAGARAAALAATLERCTLRAPIDGRVLKVLRREGEFTAASSGTPLLVVGDTSTMIVRVELIDRDAARVKVGQRAEIWLDGATKRWPGRLVEASDLMGRRTARSLDPSDRFDRDVREVLVAFDGPPPVTLVGLRVNVGFLG
ncbi:MAG: HlyD family secretion protein [Sandaracinobacteroides sp.]